MPAERPTQEQKGQAFRELHEGEPFLIPNPWDAGSAKLFAALGFKARASSSGAFAMTLGRRDGEVNLDEVVEHARALDQATPLPVSIDLENGYGASPDHAKTAVTRAAEAGAVGGSIEDYDPADEEIYSLDHAAERVAAASDAARALETETGATFVHAFDDPRVVAGQGTLGIELAEQLPSGPGTVVVPVGGGGLASGVAIALREMRPELRLVGVQAAACAPFAGREPAGTTIADGIAVKRPVPLTREILEDLLDEIVVVDDEEISQAIVILLERAKLVVEGAGAAPVAALLAGRAGGEGMACAILAGGNIDATTLNSVIRYGLTVSGRHLVVTLLIPDRPGELSRIVGILAEERANILAVAHHREGRNIGILETVAEVRLETRGEEHSQLVIRALSSAGYTVTRQR